MSCLSIAAAGVWLADALACFACATIGDGTMNSAITLTTPTNLPIFIPPPHVNARTQRYRDWLIRDLEEHSCRHAASYVFLQGACLPSGTFTLGFTHLKTTPRA